MTDTTQPPGSVPPRASAGLPNFDAVGSGKPPPVVAAARLAEELGFDAAWAGDHLACPAPGLDAPSCLSAAAAVTERISLGISVMLLGLRQPAWSAKILATIDPSPAGASCSASASAESSRQEFDRRRSPGPPARRPS